MRLADLPVRKVVRLEEIPTKTKRVYVSGTRRKYYEKYREQILQRLAAKRRELGIPEMQMSARKQYVVRVFAFGQLPFTQYSWTKYHEGKGKTLGNQTENLSNSL